MIKRLPALVALLFVAALSSAAERPYLLPESFNVVYTVSVRGITAGSAEIGYQRLGEDRYLYSSITKPSGLVGLFRNTVVQETSRGLITESGFRPEVYQYRKTGDKERYAELRFDWEAGQVVNDVENKPWRMAIDPGVTDRLVAQLQLMWSLSRKHNDKTLSVADGGKLRTFTIRVEGRETIDTPMGRFETVKITRSSEDGKYVTTFWCAPALSYLVVKGQHNEKGEKFTMRLESLKGFDTPRGS